MGFMIQGSVCSCLIAPFTTSLISSLLFTIKMQKHHSLKRSSSKSSPKSKSHSSRNGLATISIAFTLSRKQLYLLGKEILAKLLFSKSSLTFSVDPIFLPLVCKSSLGTSSQPLISMRNMAILSTSSAPKTSKTQETLRWPQVVEVLPANTSLETSFHLSTTANSLLLATKSQTSKSQTTPHTSIGGTSSDLKRPSKRKFRISLRH